MTHIQDRDPSLCDKDRIGFITEALITVPATRRRGTHKGMPLQIPSTTMPMVVAALVAAQGVAGTMTEAITDNQRVVP